MLKFTIYLLRFASITSILYFFILIGYSGIRTSFLAIWPVIAIAGLLLSAFLRYAARQSAGTVHTTGRVLLILFWLGFCFLLGVEGKLIHAGTTQPEQPADYVIILGAQVRGSTPSLTLQARIDKAAEYLAAHPDCLAICSGAQGTGEELSEAAAIQQGLIAHGIAPERILLEDQSTSTQENMLFSKALLPTLDTPVVIITNGFHCYRAGKLARALGYTHVDSLGADRFLATTPHYYLREFFALVKEYLVGNLSF